MEPGSSRGPARAGPIIQIDEKRWRRVVPRADLLARRAARAVDIAGDGSAGAQSIVLASDAMVKRLNARHRNRNKPTNVLTFEPAPGMPGGDIVLALGVVEREARAARRRPAHHLAHLVVHGCLHLAGHDHDAAGAARRMEMEEARILHRLGVPNPWKPRA